MSASLAIVNGDLAIGSSRSFQLVSKQAKLMQDLKLWVLERIGTDPSTPTYGSTLDGGTENGQPVESFIGQLISSASVTAIQAEVVRLLQQYQQMQANKMQAEIILYNGKTTLDPSEVIEAINSVRATAIGSQVLVQAVITTVNQSTIQLTLPV